MPLHSTNSDCIFQPNFSKYSIDLASRSPML